MICVQINGHHSSLSAFCRRAAARQLLRRTQMLLSALFESQFEIFSQQGAIDVTHVATTDIDLRCGALHKNQGKQRGAS